MCTFSPCVNVFRIVEHRSCSSPLLGSGRRARDWKHLGSWGKLAGVLIETALTASAAPDQARYCVVGVGINIAPPQDVGLSTEPLGLQQLWAEATAPRTLALVALPLLKALLAFERAGFAHWQPLFNARDALRDRVVTLSDGRTGTARGADFDGALCVDTAQGRERITSAEVSVRPQ